MIASLLSWILKGGTPNLGKCLPDVIFVPVAEWQDHHVLEINPAAFVLAVGRQIDYPTPLTQTDVAS